MSDAVNESATNSDERGNKGRLDTRQKVFDSVLQNFNVVTRHVQVAQTQRQARERPQNSQACENPAVVLPKGHVHPARQILLIKNFWRIDCRINFTANWD